MSICWLADRLHRLSKPGTNEKLVNMVVILTDRKSLDKNIRDDIEKFVKQGGGLLIIGGERNIYPEGKKVEDALDRTLPAKVAPPRSPF